MVVIKTGIRETSLKETQSSLGLIKEESCCVSNDSMILIGLQKGMKANDSYASISSFYPLVVLSLRSEGPIDGGAEA